MRKDRLQLIIAFLIIAIITLFTSSQFETYEVISLQLFFFILLKFIYDLGSHLTIKNIIALIMVLQWLIGPILGYLYEPIIPNSYQMAVDKSTYFGFILPATLANLAGLYLPISRRQQQINFSASTDYFQKGRLLILLGFFFEFMPGFGFLGYLLAGLKYIGTFYMIITPNKEKKYWIGAVYGYLFFVHSLGSGQFHEMLLWSCFLLMLIFYFTRKSFLYRLCFIFTGLFLVMIVQIIKPNFRAQIQSDAGSNKTTIFLGLVTDKIFGDEPLFSEEDIANNVTRINQGWIISNVLNYMPEKRPFVHGQTIYDAFEASLLPRFMAPNKPKAGGYSNMKNYAGITLNEGTSMDISQVGEAYANFGDFGGIIMMFFVGLFFNWVITFIEKKLVRHPELALWIPLLFLQVVKAETSLVTVLNHLVKASLVTWFFFSPYGEKLLSYRFGKWKFGVRTFKLSSKGSSSRGVRPRKGFGEKKRYEVFEDRVKKKQ